MGSSWYHLLGNDYGRLLILDLLFMCCLAFGKSTVPIGHC